MSSRVESYSHDMTIKRTTNCSEEEALHLEVTEETIEQPHIRTDRQTDRQTKRKIVDVVVASGIVFS